MPHAERVQRLSHVATALADAVTPEQVAATIVERGTGGAGAYAGAIHLLSADRTQLVLLRSAGFSDVQLEGFRTVDAAAPLPICEAARDGHPIFLGTPTARAAVYPELHNALRAAGAPPRSPSLAWAALPLIARGHTLGTLALSFDEPRDFASDERTFLSAVAQQCALALDRALLLREQEIAAAELRRTVDALNARELQLRLAQQAAAAGSWELEPETDRVWLSPELAALLDLPAGHEPVDFAAMTARVHAPDRERIRGALAAALSTHELDMEFRYEHPRLGTRRFSVIGRLIAASGHPPRLHGIIVDVTARRDAEDRLRRQEEHMRVAVDAASLGTWIWDVSGDRGLWDGTMSRMFATEPGEVEHNAFFLSRVHPDDRGRMQRVLAAAVESLDTYQDEYRIVLPSGEVRWIADHARVFRDDTGRALSIAGVSLDVTERRRADEQLRQMQRIESVGRLAGGMAHEINNMMSVVLGFAEFVMRHPALPHESRRDLGEIQKAAERAASVTRQVLAFSRQQVLLPETLDINAVVTEAHAMLSRLLGEDIDLVLDLTPRVGQVRADRNQIIQALVNLSINARDAMPGGGEVTISTAPTVVGATDLRRHIGADAVPGEYVSITVTDTGTGMDASVLARAFEPFFTTKPVGNGTGLGLSTVYGIVKQSGGYVWAQSAPGAGTTFNVLLPRSTAEVTAAPAARVPAGGIEGNGTILVVEDEPLVRTMARRTLEELGYDVVDAPGGAAALELAMDLGDELRLVITDVVMPGMNGRDFAARLLERRPDLPVLFVSGHPSQFVVEQGLLERGQAFLQKPFLPDVLGAAVRSLLEAVYR